jgi:hypothetical protein
MMAKSSLIDDLAEAYRSAKTVSGIKEWGRDSKYWVISTKRALRLSFFTRLSSLTLENPNIILKYIIFIRVFAS